MLYIVNINTLVILEAYVVKDILSFEVKTHQICQNVPWFLFVRSSNYQYCTHNQGIFFAYLISLHLKTQYITYYKFDKNHKSDNFFKIIMLMINKILRSWSKNLVVRGWPFAMKMTSIMLWRSLKKRWGQLKWQQGNIRF